MNVLRSTRVCAAVLMLAIIGGCAPTNQSASDPSPGLAGAQSGLDLQWWRVDDRNNTLAQSLAPYLDQPVPMRESVRALWQRNGLRVVSVPIDQLKALRNTPQSPPPSGQTQGTQHRPRPASVGVTRVHSEWLGQRPRWTEIASGPTMPSGAVLALDSGRIRLSPGRARLLARCWAVPLTGDSSRVGAGLRIELALQWADLTPRRSTQPTLEAVSIDRTAQNEGLVFTRFVAEMTALKGQALVIVTDRPDARWDQPDEAPPLSLPAATVPTLGRTLLGDPGGDRPSHIKIVLALVPQIPDEYELIRR